ncbi:MAG: hypothetical protein IJQ56_06890, partial [Synergistaceae bacterium]|nr:hypothetical protein [Synergistaceae bacterium]
ASGIILGEVMPSGRSFLNPEILLNHNQKNFLQEKIIENMQKYSGRMMIQRSAGTKIQLIRAKDSPNTGAIIRPDGNIRLDCVAPFVIGNVLDDDFCRVWNTKAHNVWQSPEIQEYIDSWEDEEEISHGLRNYFDSDIKL